MNFKKTILLTAACSLFTLFSGQPSHSAPGHHHHHHSDLADQYRKAVYLKPELFNKWLDNVAHKKDGAHQIVSLHDKVKNWALVGPTAFKNYDVLKQLSAKEAEAILVEQYRKVLYQKPAVFNKWLNNAIMKSGIEHIVQLHDHVKNWALAKPVAFTNYFMLAKLADKAPAPQVKDAPIAPKVAPVAQPKVTPVAKPGHKAPALQAQEKPIAPKVAPVAQPKVSPLENLQQNPQYKNMLNHFDGTTDFDAVAKKITQMPHGFVEMKASEYVNKMKGPKQGWKLHVSATKENMYAIAKLIFPYLETQQVGWKFAGSKAFYDQLCQSETQGGKFITIYSPTDDKAVQLAKDIDALLLKGGFTAKDFVKSKHEAALGKSGGVFTRYGAYTGYDVYKVDKNNKQLSNKPIFDDREKYKPDFITSHPFGSMLVPPQHG